MRIGELAAPKLLRRLQACAAHDGAQIGKLPPFAPQQAGRAAHVLDGDPAADVGAGELTGDSHEPLELHAMRSGGTLARVDAEDLGRGRRALARRLEERELLYTDGIHAARRFRRRAYRRI